MNSLFNSEKTIHSKQVIGLFQKRFRHRKFLLSGGGREEKSVSDRKGVQGLASVGEVSMDVYWNDPCTNHVYFHYLFTDHG